MAGDQLAMFGGGCTAEIISDKGLVLTNHHCGFDAVQNHSSLENNYIRDGYWAKDNKEENINFSNHDEHKVPSGVFKDEEPIVNEKMEFGDEIQTLLGKHQNAMGGGNPATNQFNFDDNKKKKLNKLNINE